MQTEIVEVMRTQVRVIHRALTDHELPETEAPAESESGAHESEEDIVRRFLELDAATRSLPAVAARVPPFSFTPAVDVIAGDDAVIVELALPGIARGDVTVERVDGGLVVVGIRRHEHPDARAFHAEIPRGPFGRMIPVPFPIEHEPRVELERGVLRIHLASGVAIPASPDRSSTIGEQGNDDDSGHE